MANHPSYQSPTIHEALCEIHFELAGQAVIPSAVFGDFYAAISEEFPGLEPVTLVPVLIQMGAGGVAQEFQTPEQRMRYRHQSRPLLIQLSPHTLTVNVLPKYEGWETMRHDVVTAWEELCSVLPGVPKVVRVGLRYINFIPRESEEETPGAWIVPSDYIPASICGSRPGFMYRMQTYKAPDERLIVSVGEAAEPNESAAGQLVLDIDRISEQKQDGSTKSLSAQLDALHSDVWEVFNSSISPQLRLHLEGSKS